MMDILKSITNFYAQIVENKLIYVDDMTSFYWIKKRGFGKRSNYRMSENAHLAIKLQLDYNLFKEEFGQVISFHEELMWLKDNENKTIEDYL